MIQIVIKIIYFIFFSMGYFKKCYISMVCTLVYGIYE